MFKKKQGFSPYTEGNTLSFFSKGWNLALAGDPIPKHPWAKDGFLAAMSYAKENNTPIPCPRNYLRFPKD